LERPRRFPPATKDFDKRRGYYSRRATFFVAAVPWRTNEEARLQMAFRPRAATALLAALAALAPRACPALALTSAFTYSVPCAPKSASMSAAYAVGDRAYLCITLNGLVVSMYNVVVDKFTAIALQGSNFGLPPGSGFIQDGVGNVSSIGASSNASDTRVFYQVFDVAVLGAASAYPRVFKRLTYSHAAGAGGALVADVVTFPIYTAIITLDRGAVTAVAFDEGCFFCAENTPQCDYNAVHANASQTIYDRDLKGCRLEQEACYPKSFSAAALAGNASAAAAANATLAPAAANATVPVSPCDLRLYVVWSGTDAKGNGLMSANKRFSRYRQFNVATAYQSALNAADTVSSLAARTKSTFEAIPGQITGGGDRGRRLGEAAAEGGAGGAAAAGAGGAQEAR